MVRREGERREDHALHVLLLARVVLFRPPDREVLRVEEDEVLRVFVALDVLLGVPDGFVELGLQVGARVEGGDSEHAACC